MGKKVTSVGIDVNIHESQGRLVSLLKKTVVTWGTFMKFGRYIPLGKLKTIVKENFKYHMWLPINGDFVPNPGMYWYIPLYPYKFCSIRIILGIHHLDVSLFVFLKF